MQNFEEVTAYLKKANGAGRTLHDHLTDVLLTLAKEKPDNPLEVFERLSAQLKKNGLGGADLKEVPSRKFPLEAKDKITSYIQQVVQLCKPEKKKVAEDEEVEEEEEPDLSFLPDIMSEAALLQWGGASLGEEEAYKILLSVKRFAATAPVSFVRFFGKILGTEKDYYVVETKLKEYPEEDESTKDPMDKREKSGEGTNEYVYFVCNDLCESWVRLPDVTPEQIQVARQMRRFFSGKLSAAVPGYPHFPWGEASYLRAQLARISCATVVAPAGLYSLNEEDEEGNSIIESEEFSGTAEDLKTAAGWSHHRPHLLRQGRFKPWTPPEKEEEEDEDAKEAQPEQEVDNEEPAEKLRKLEEDQENGKPCWSFRAYPVIKSAVHSIVCANSLLWPGALAVAQGKKFSNIYIGYGQKQLQSKYSPPPFPTILAEYSPVKPEDADEEWANPLQEQTDPLPPPPEPAKEENAEDAGDEEEENQEEDE